jgi:hypothetical protein
MIRSRYSPGVAVKRLRPEARAPAAAISRTSSSAQEISRKSYSPDDSPSSPDADARPDSNSGMRQSRQAVDEWYARRRRRRRGTRGVARDHDRFGQRSVRVEMEGMADIHVPAGYCVHPRTGAPQVAALAVGIAGRKTLGRRARWDVRVRRRTLGGGLRRTCSQPHSCGTQATRHEGGGCNRGDKSPTHRVSFRKTPLRWRCYCGEVASLQIATDSQHLASGALEDSWSRSGHRA